LLEDKLKAREQAIERYGDERKRMATLLDQERENARKAHENTRDLQEQILNQTTMLQEVNDGLNSKNEELQQLRAQLEQHPHQHQQERRDFVQPTNELERLNRECAELTRRLKCMEVCLVLDFICADCLIYCLVRKRKRHSRGHSVRTTKNI
jgi:chromosome segregation ATPase